MIGIQAAQIFFTLRAAAKIRSEIRRSCFSRRDLKVNVSRTRGNLRRAREKWERKRFFRETQDRESFDSLAVATLLTVQATGRRTMMTTTTVEVGGGDERKLVGRNFRNHCDRGNFADFKRVSFGLFEWHSNANNATGRPIGRQRRL